MSSLLAIPQFPGTAVLRLTEEEYQSLWQKFIYYSVPGAKSFSGRVTGIYWTENDVATLENGMKNAMKEQDWSEENWEVSEKTTFFIGEWKKGKVVFSIAGSDDLSADDIEDYVNDGVTSFNVLKPDSSFFVGYLRGPLEHIEFGTTNSATATAYANQIIEQEINLENLSETFDKQLAKNWIIEPNDPSAWDLTIQPGMLHLANGSDSEENTRTTLSTDLPEIGFDVEVKLLLPEMNTPGQSLWLGLTSDKYPVKDDSALNSFSIPGETFQIGIAIDDQGRKEIHTLTCALDYCEKEKQLVLHEKAGFTLPEGELIYLGLSRIGKTSSTLRAFFSFDGKTWFPLGYVINFPKVSKLNLVLSGGDTKFEAFVDYVKFGLKTH